MVYIVDKALDCIKEYLPRPIKRTILEVKAIPGKRLRHRLANTYRFPGDFRRIYFYHIRKTAGTSLNCGFFNLSGKDGNSVQETIFQSQRGVGVVGNYVFVGHNKYLIEVGDYYYGYSHTASQEFQLPPNTFTITILRDPVNRVISHYRNLMHYHTHNEGAIHLRKEGAWLGKSFADFLDNIPAAHLMRQIYMFSRTFNTDEAFEKIINLNFVMFTETFANGLTELGRQLNITLKLFHSKSNYDPAHVSHADRTRLREMLEPEYQLLNRIRQHFVTTNDPHLL